MTLAIYYSHEFKRNVRKLIKKYPSLPNDLNGFIDSLHAGEKPGEKLQHVGQEVYKARIRNTDNQKGKSAGYRVIYYVKRQDQIFLVTLYAKSAQEDVSIEKILTIIEDCQQE